MGSRTQVEDLKSTDGNDKCADCGAAAPNWVVMPHGVFVCINCVGCHRALGTHISQAKSIELDSWTHGDLEILRQHGNFNCNKMLEANVPELAVRGTPKMNQRLREAWVRAKYQHRCFAIDGNPEAFKTDGTKRGFLNKREKSGSKCNRRWCVLEAKTAGGSDYTLRYFLDQLDTKPAKGEIELQDATLQLDENDESLSFTITCHCRTYFLTADSSEDLYSWINSWRYARARSFGWDGTQLTCDILQQYKRLLDTKSISAIFEKPGPSMKNYKSRVFHLSERFLTYKKEFKDSIALGMVKLGLPSDGYEVSISGNGEIELAIPGRKFLLRSSSQDSSRIQQHRFPHSQEEEQEQEKEEQEQEQEQEEQEQEQEEQEQEQEEQEQEEEQE
eukprot:gene10791-2874_t